jgi:hypothetical protein
MRRWLKGKKEVLPSRAYCGLEKRGHGLHS